MKREGQAAAVGAGGQRCVELLVWPAGRTWDMCVPFSELLLCAQQGQVLRVQRPGCDLSILCIPDP